MRIKSLKLNGKQLLPTEHQEQAKFFQMLALEEQRDPRLKWVHAIGNGGKRHIVTALRMKAEGVKKGILDVFVPIPVAPYHGLYIEMKRLGESPTPEQIEFAKYARSQDYRISLAYTAEEAMTGLKYYLSGH